MELVNEIYASEVKSRQDELSKRVMREAIETVVLLLSPFVPHFSEELWEALGNKESIVKSEWPDYDREAVAVEEILIVIQVNGKLRGTVSVPPQATEAEIRQMAESQPAIAKFLTGTNISRVIYVPVRTMNFVVK